MYFNKVFPVHIYQAKNLSKVDMALSSPGGYVISLWRWQTQNKQSNKYNYYNLWKRLGRERKKSICIPAQSRGVEEADNKGLGDSTLCLSGNSSFRDIELIQEKTYLFILQIFIKFLLITKFWKLGKLTPIALTY